MDIIGFDSYEIFAYELFLIPNCHLVVSFAEEHGKIAALTEFGVNGGIQFAATEDWFTNTFLRPIKEDSIARKLAFALTWRNDRSNHHWIPLPGSPNHGSFMDFYKDEFTLFEKDLPNMYDCEQITDIDSVNSKEVLNGFQLKISPNPTTDFLQIRLSEKTQFNNFCTFGI